ERSTNPQADLIALAQQFTDKPKWAAFSDLNWARLTPWRKLLAGFYDVADYRPHLRRVNRVMIDYISSLNDSHQIPTSPLMIAGWLASRLGWSINSAEIEDSATVFQFSKSDGQALSIHLNRRQAEQASSHIISKIALLEADNRASFQVEQGTEAHWLTTEVTIGTEHRPCHMCSHEPEGTERLLENELENLGADRVYEQAVICTGRMLQALTSIQN
ncbi:MAG TPA: OpcA/G6PD domain-containing protein, partial [Blastocatellia bacterium]|nr:OpcA/G6PD domain-containing protein [Blastocatellia bacterium]